MLKRNVKGSLIVETPAALWVLFVLFIVPFIDFATVYLRYTYFVAASRDGVHSAATAKTYFSDLSPSDLSARSMANNSARRTAAAFSEITVTDVTTRIVITDLNTRSVSRRTTPLAAPADTGLNLYQFETTVTGNINPLVTFNTGIFTGIPGLSAPVPVSVSSREFVENPQGLNQ